MTTVRNTDTQTRTWSHLVNTETGTTLELAPGEKADTVLPHGSQGGMYLEIVEPKAPRPPKGKRGTKEAPPADKSEDAKDPENDGSDDEHVNDQTDSDAPGDTNPPAEAPADTSKE